MNARGYIEAGHAIEAEGWIITLADLDEMTLECPVAVHKDTHQIMRLAYNTDWRSDEPTEDMAYYSTSWDSSPLDEHWGNPAKLMEELGRLNDRGLLRVRDAIHGLPGADPLGALTC